MTDVVIDVGAAPLGAYSITVTYDPAVLRIASVAGDSSPEFSGTPTTNAASFASGITNVSAFQTRSLTRPTGIVRVARITFDVVGMTSTTTSIGLALHNLFDTASDPISAIATGCMVPVRSTSSTRDTGRG